uniref:Uncharacterized protein n=1 Tax=Anguilla anguilla TaxID=7936 RepID=A0A0E9S355_ANGAN
MNAVSSFSLFEINSGELPS